MYFEALKVFCALVSIVASLLMVVTCNELSLMARESGRRLASGLRKDVERELVEVTKTTYSGLQEHRSIEFTATGQKTKWWLVVWDFPPCQLFPADAWFAGAGVQLGA
jgi:hypothetical protein